MSACVAFSTVSALVHTPCTDMIAGSLENTHLQQTVYLEALALVDAITFSRIDLEMPEILKGQCSGTSPVQSPCSKSLQRVLLRM